MSRAATVQTIESCGVVGIIRLKDPSHLPAVVQALADGGVRALEITMTVPGAVALIDTTAKTLPPGFLLGAGTVLDPDTARRVVDAGARFLVSPILKIELIDAARDLDVPIMPGCFSPTEILAAWDAGADIIKLFPATALGPGYIKDVHGPLPQVKLMPTGGVSVENAGEWIKGGAVGVGVGSALLDPAAIAARRYDVIRERARQIVENVNRARESRP